jgi:hypothetical protein
MKRGIALGFLSVLISSCSYLALQSDSKDCGFTASFTFPDRGGGAMILFSRVLAEESNGQTNCGLASVPTKVDKAFVDGKDLSLVTIGEDVVYVAPTGFDPATQAINIEVHGRSYITDQNNFRRDGNRYVIGLRPFPPK